MSDHVRFHRDESRIFNLLSMRSRILQLTRQFFIDRGFLEVETPIVCSSPGVEVHLDAMEVRAGREIRYLTTSPEFHMKRLVAVGFDRVFQVTRAFRSGEYGTRHNPEFTMIEWYRRGEDYSAIMRDCEDLLSHLAIEINGHATSLEVPALRPRLDLTPPYRQTTVIDAFARAGLPSPIGMDPVRRDELLVERVEPLLGRPTPEFLTEYPADAASLAQLKSDNPEAAERFELYAGELELANGFSELSDADLYVARCEADLAQRKEMGLPEYPIDHHYVSMLRDGMPTCAGTALGFDRVVMLLLGAGSISDVIAFPWDLA